MTYEEHFKHLTGKEMTREQKTIAKSITDEDKAKEYLTLQVEQALVMVYNKLGIEVEVGDIASGLFTNDRVYKLNPTNLPKFISGIPAERLVELTKKKYDFWGNLYRKYLNRDPDPEGLEWWASTIEHWFKKGIK